MSSLTKKRVHWHELNNGIVTHDEDVDILTSADAVTYSDGDTVQDKFNDGVFATSSNVGDITGLSTTNKSSVVDAVNEVVTSVSTTNSSLTTLSGKVGSVGATDLQTQVDTINTDLTNTNSIVGNKTINLLPNVAVSQNISGVSVVVNDDKTITLNGKSTDIIYINTAEITIDNSEYTLSGCYGVGSDTSYVYQIYHDNTFLTDYGNGKTFSNQAGTFISRICIASGQTFNNATFKPMLEKGNVKHNYVPFVGENYNVMDAIGGISQNVDKLNENLATIGSVTLLGQTPTGDGTGNFTLSDNINNYRLLCIQLFTGTSMLDTITLPPCLLTTDLLCFNGLSNHSICIYDNTGNTVLTYYRGNADFIYNVYGIK